MWFPPVDEVDGTPHEEQGADGQQWVEIEQQPGSDDGVDPGDG